mmetsp:Transcript_34979/g.85719  ORF Transcript_34979/g.85719 Transcript_34979/m.85719 type:complete len:82 (-) Transcript_34979:609-854(-)
MGINKARGPFADFGTVEEPAHAIILPKIRFLLPIKPAFFSSSNASAPHGAFNIWLSMDPMLAPLFLKMCDSGSKAAFEANM